MSSPREHIEEIRRKKFSIGVEEENPLDEDLHHAVRHLSVELYSKDVHFLMELLQNAEDNEYPDDEVPILEFVVTSRDITGVGAPATLLVFNNEKGFSRANIESLCSVGRSTKKGKRSSGYIGEKEDIGCPEPTLILPLRDEKVDDVKQQLNNLHPEMILFMSKIRTLSVRDTDENSFPESVRQISVSRETACGSCRDEKCNSFTLHLSSEENNDSKENGYYMWRQRFPVRPENYVEERLDVEEWTITLAFPMDDRLTTSSSKESTSRVGIYAFLPTEMVTGFPFIIQSDFILSSSRETVLFDNKWNKGIIECIPQAFCKAFISFTESEKSAPPISKSGVFRYLPIVNPCHQVLKQIRESVKQHLMHEHIIFCESLQYSTPAQAHRILADFRNFISNALRITDGVEVYTTNGQQVVHSSMENNSQNIKALEFFNVDYIYSSWYSDCFQHISSLIPNLSEEDYAKFLYFLSMCNSIMLTHMKFIPIIKYSCGGNRVSWICLDNLLRGTTKIYISSNSECISWLAKWSNELGRAMQYHFMPERTESAIRNLGSGESSNLLSWVSYKANITELSVYCLSEKLVRNAANCHDKDFVVRVAQFVFFSYQHNHLSKVDAIELCKSLPVVSSTEKIIRSKKKLSKERAPPKSVSKLNILLGTTTCLDENQLLVLSESYLQLPSCAHGLRGQESLTGAFMNEFLQAKDIPDLTPVRVPLNGLTSLSQVRALLLMEWVQQHSQEPLFPDKDKFRESLRQQKWLKTYKGFQTPCSCLLFQSEWETSVGITCNDLNFIDEPYYENHLVNYKKALQLLGVRVKFGEYCCDLVAEQLQSHTNFSTITKLYSFLHTFKYKGLITSSIAPVKVWIPSSDTSGKWMQPTSCVINDNEGIFSHRLKILSNYYEKDLLDFFTCSARVSREPTLEQYCRLWTDWASGGHKVNLFECSCVWKKIVEYWSGHNSSTIKRLLSKGEDACGYWKQVCKEDIRLPVISSNGQGIELKFASQVFIPDNLHFRDLFMASKSSIHFAWYPKHIETVMPVDKLFKIYSDLGAKYISNVVEKGGVSMKSGCAKKLKLENECLFSEGMYKTILAFLAEPSRKFSLVTRHGILKTLFECDVYEAEEPLVTEYRLTLNRNVVKATSHCHVKFEKDARKIFIHKKANETKKLATFELITEFAEVISSEILSGQSPDVVCRLEELLKLGGVVDFEEEAVDFMLYKKNPELFAEDVEFLEKHVKNKGMNEVG